MKKNIYITVVCLIMCFQNIFAQGPAFSWAKVMGSSTSDGGCAIVKDAAGNVYTTGYFGGTTDFDPGPGTFTLPATSSKDIYIQKLDFAGNFVWAKSVGSVGDDIGRSIALDVSGNVYVTGYFSYTVDFDPGPATYTLQAKDNTTIFLLKLDAAGNFIWVKQIGANSFSPNFNSGESLKIDLSGNIYMGGYFQGVVDFNPGPTTNNKSSFSSSLDFFILKLNAIGNYLWTFTGGSYLNDEGHSIALDNSGNCYLTGFFRDIGDFNPSAGSYTLGSVGQEDLFIEKVDVNGNFVWASSCGGLYTDIGYSIDIDGYGNVLSTGSFRDDVDFDPGISTYTLSSGGIFTESTYIQKLDASGNFMWTKELQTSTGVSITGFALCADIVGNVYTAGLFSGTTDFNPNTGVFNLSPAGISGIYISKLNTLGNFVWAKTVGGFTQPYGFGMEADDNGNVYLSSNTSGTYDFDPGPAVFNLIPVGATDIFTLKLSCTASSNTITTSVCNTYTAPSGILYSSSGNYIDIIPNGKGCDSIITINLTVLNTVTASIASQTNVLCNGGNTASVTLNVTGGIGPITYSWIPTGGTSSSAVNLTAGNYTCIITDNGNSCTRRQNVTITQPTAITSTVLTKVNLLCNGAFTGSATIGTGGGTGTKTYSWLPTGGTSSVAVGLGAGTYTCVITDANLCIKTQTLIITQPTAITSSVFAQNNVSCFGLSNGTATISTSGGTGTKTYSWIPTGGTFSAAINLPAGTYTCIVKDANNCTRNQTLTISQPSALNAASSQTNVTCVVNGAAQVSVTGGVGGYTYTWSPTGGNASQISGVNAGTYTCTIKDVNNCTLTKTVSITSNTIAPFVTVSGSNTVCSGQSVLLTASGANTYLWNTGPSNTTITPSPTVTTTYSVYGTSTGNGCSGIGVHTVFVYTVPVVVVNSGIICSGQSFTMTPSGATTYTFQGGNAVVSPTTNSSYTVTGTNSQGCVSSAPAVSSVTINPLPIVTVNSGIICSGQSFTMTPSGATTYTFQGGNAVVSPTTNSSYTVTGTNAQGCVSSTAAISSVTVNSLPAINIASTSSLICIGQTVTLTASGANTYSWNTTTTTASIVESPSITITYSVIGTDVNGCSNSATITQSVSVCSNINSYGFLNESIRVYPNPNNGEFTFSTPKAGAYQVINSLGQQVCVLQVDEGSQKININLANGIYYMISKTEKIKIVIAK